MNEEDMKAELQNCERIAKAIEDPELRKEAFRKLLDIKFGVTKKPTDPDTKTAYVKEQSAPSASVSSTETEENILRLCEQIGVTEEQLHRKFDFNSEIIRIYHPPAEGTRTGVQIKSLMMLSILMKKIKGVSNFNASDLLNASKLPIERIDNLNNNVDYKRIFSGNARGLQFTWVGEKESLDLLKQHVSEAKKQGV